MIKTTVYAEVNIKIYEINQRRYDTKNYSTADSTCVWGPDEKEMQGISVGP